MLDGYRMWRDGGLKVPEAVRRATAAYRAESDPLGPFIAAACVITGSDELVEFAADLWRAYLAWCKKNATKAIFQNTFGRRLRERKGVRAENVGTIRYLGIAVVDRTLFEAPYDEPDGAESPEHDDAR